MFRLFRFVQSGPARFRSVEQQAADRMNAALEVFDVFEAFRFVRFCSILADVRRPPVTTARGGGGMDRLAGDSVHGVRLSDRRRGRPLVGLRFEITISCRRSTQISGMYTEIPPA